VISSSISGRPQDLEGTHQRVIDGHHRPGIIEFSAIIRRRENGNELPFGEELVAVLDDLMSAHNQVELMAFQEVLNHIGSKGEGHASVILAPALDVGIGIGPHKVAQQPRVRNVRRPHNTPNLFQTPQIWGKAAMDAQDLVLNDGAEWQTVKAVIEGFPDLEVVSLPAFVVEAINAIDRAALMIASEHEEVLGIFDFVGKKEADGFQAIWATINVVAQEEVVGLWGEASVFKEAQEVVVLPMNVADNFQRGF